MNMASEFRSLPFKEKFAVVAGLCSILGFLGWLLSSMLPTSPNVSVKDAPNAKVQTAINSPNTTQIITDHLIISGPPQEREPHLTANVAYANKPEGGKFKTVLDMFLDTPSPVPRLYVEVRAATIEEARLHHARTGADFTAIYPKKEGIAQASLQNAKGRIKLELISSQPERFDVRYDFPE